LRVARKASYEFSKFRRFQSFRGAVSETLKP
jgi:hypothetical protein